MRAVRFVAPSLVFGFGVFAACGGGPRAPVASASTTTSASSASSGPAVDADRTACARVCAIQNKCGGDPSKCMGRCMPAARVLLPSVLDAMVSCVEARTPTNCNADPQTHEAHTNVLGDCIGESIASRESDARTIVTLFAKTWCDRTHECGTDEAWSPSRCLGESQGSIMDENRDWPLYGAVRPSKVDAVVACLKKGACESRAPAATATKDCLMKVLDEAEP